MWTRPESLAQTFLISYSLTAHRVERQEVVTATKSNLPLPLPCSEPPGGYLHVQAVPVVAAAAADWSSSFGNGAKGSHLTQ